MEQKNKQDDVPFKTSSKTKPIAVAGKYGIGPSTAKHLAKMGLKQQMDKTKKESVEMDEMSQAQMNKREEIVKSMKKSFPEFRKRYGEKAKEVMYATATKQAMKEEEESEEEIYSEHMCAQHVYHDVFGEGVVVEGEHAVPDDNGDIAWYSVQFPHGKEVVFTEDVKIMAERYHGHMMKKKKMAETVKHPNQQVLDVHEPEKDELTAKDFEMLRKIKKNRMK